MSELNFPKNPIVGQEYTFNSLLYMFDGVKWVTKGTGYNPVQDLYKMYASDAGASLVGVHGYDNVQAALENLNSIAGGLQAQVNTKINADFVSRFDRESLRRSYADAGYQLVLGSFGAGGAVTTATDVLLYEAEGKAYSYTGTLPHTVATGSSPSVEPGMWVDRSGVVAAAILRSESVVAELGGRAQVFNRQTYEQCRLSAPTSAPANAGYQQGIFVRDAERVVYVTYDPDGGTGTKYIGKYNLKTNSLISECIVSDSRVGHLDSLYVDGAGIAYTTGSVGNPAILKIDTATGIVIEAISLSMAHTSQILLAVDTSVPDEFIVWGRFGGDKIIVSGNFSNESGGVIPVIPTPISYPQPDILQGIALLRDRAYTLTGAGGAGVKYLTEYRVTTGEAVASVEIKPNLIFSDQLGGVYEPEGLCISSERNGTAPVTNIYIGWVFGDGTKANSKCVIYKYSPIGSRQVPSIDYYAGRAAGAIDYQIKDIVIRLRYGSGTWAIESGDFLSVLTQNSIRNLAISGDNLSITFDLIKPYQDVLGWSCDGSGDLFRAGRVKPVWMHKAGGGTSNIGHQIRLVDLDSPAYKVVNAAPIADGQRLSLMLRVIE